MSKLTNQKLLFAQVQLDACAEILHQAQTPREHLLAQSHAEACVLHLMQVYRCFLDEISGAYRLQDLALPSGLGAYLLPAYVDACLKRDVISPEFNYLHELSKDPASCLSVLALLFEQQCQVPAAETKTHDHSEQRITLQSSEAQDPLLTLLDRLVWLLPAFRAAIAHCRQTLQEY